VVSATKVLPQLLGETRDMIAAAWPRDRARPDQPGRAAHPDRP
jgi:hypothetical protein